MRPPGEFYVDESERDDIRQQAAEFLFKALDDFNPKMGTRFSTFAWKSVRADLKDWLREMGRLRRHVSTELIAETNEAALGLYASSFCESRCRAQNISRAVRKNVEPLRIILMRG